MGNYVNFALNRISEDAKRLYYYVLEKQSYNDNCRGISLGIEDIRKIIGCARQKAVLLKQVLVGVGLLENVRLGLGRKNILYAVPQNCYDEPEDIIETPEENDDLEEIDYIKEEKTVIDFKQETDKKSNNDRYLQIRSKVMQNIGFIDLKQKYGKDRLLGIVQLITDVITLNDGEKIVIAKKERSASQVKQQFSLLRYGHIEYIFDCLDSQTGQIRNIKSYLLACLYNAVSTIDSYYKNMTLYGLYGA